MSRHPRDTAARRPSISAIPDLTLLPTPLAAVKVPAGQLLTKTSSHYSSALEDRDFDDIGSRWYKDVIVVSTSDGKFVESLGGAHLVQKKLEPGTEAGTIEAEEMHVRMLKDASATLDKIARLDQEAGKWIRERLQAGEEIGFVTVVRDVTNPSYKRARLVDVGLGNYEVMREVGGEPEEGKRRDSGLEVVTGSKKDAVGVLVHKVEEVGGKLKLGDQAGAQFWN